ncbi:ricin-type beta-trefoil lectin domain protein [Melittangium boletus]|uniref:ricin-type beta-trefoil lectin domain protein n=1 Tax=Melittangium boletus TaxID=83453 RepID=UPI003DA57CDA
MNAQTALKHTVSFTALLGAGLAALGCGAPEDVLERSAQDGSPQTAAESLTYPFVEYRSGVGAFFCLDVRMGTPVSETPVHIWACNSTYAQQWAYNPNTQELRSALNVNLCLDVQGGTSAPNTPVQIYYCNGTAAQRWIRNGNELRTVLNPSYCLDVRGGVASQGTIVQIYACNNSASQQWLLQ